MTLTPILLYEDLDVQKVPEEARVPYEYLGSGRWRKLPESSPRNYDNWDKYRQMQQGSIYRRLQTSLQRQLDSFS